MSLWDPEAAGNAAQYLRLPEIALCEIRNAPFIGANAVWVPNSETGYMKAEICADQSGAKSGQTKVIYWLFYPLS